MGILRRFREWREDKDGVLTGPDIDADSINTESVSYDYSDQWPLWPRQPEAAVPTAWTQDPAAKNPIWTIDDVDDETGDGLADVFAAVEDGTVHLFAEVFDSDAPQAAKAIVHATYDGSLEYDQVVLHTDDTGFAISYPCTFKFGGDWYQIHSNPDQDRLEILPFDPFPINVSTNPEATFAPSGFDPKDPTIFEFNGKWWLWVFNGGSSPEETHAYYSDSPITDDWTAHANNPIIADDKLARNAGLPFGGGHSLFVPRRDPTPGSVSESDHNEIVRAIVVNELTTSTFSYSEPVASPIVQPTGSGQAWNDFSQHQFSGVTGDEYGQTVAFVDGRNTAQDYSVGVYVPADNVPVRAQGTPSSNVTLPASESYADITTGNSRWDFANTLTENGFEVPEDGWYELTVNLRLSGSDLSGLSFPFQMTFQFRDRGGSSYLFADRSVSGPNDEYHFYTHKNHFSEGEVLYAQAKQSSGSDVDVLTASTFDVEKLDK